MKRDESYEFQGNQRIKNKNKGFMNKKIYIKYDCFDI